MMQPVEVERLVARFHQRALPADDIRRIARAFGDEGNLRHAPLAPQVFLERLSRRLAAKPTWFVNPHIELREYATALSDPALVEGLENPLGRAFFQRLARLIVMLVSEHPGDIAFHDSVETSHRQMLLDAIPYRGANLGQRLVLDAPPGRLDQGIAAAVEREVGERMSASRLTGDWAQAILDGKVLDANPPQFGIADAWSRLVAVEAAALAQPQRLQGIAQERGWQYDEVDVDRTFEEFARHVTERWCRIQANAEGLESAWSRARDVVANLSQSAYARGAKAALTLIAQEISAERETDERDLFAYFAEVFPAEDIAAVNARLSEPAAREALAGIRRLILSDAVLSRGRVEGRRAVDPEDGRDTLVLVIGVADVQDEIRQRLEAEALDLVEAAGAQDGVHVSVLPP